MRVRWFTLLLVVVASVAVCFAQSRRSKRTKVESSLKGTKVILISQYMARTGDEAMLITDPGRIEELVRLFSNNRTVGHACGYHWNIWFRQSATESTVFSHNEDCEVYEHYNQRIHELLNGFFKTILNTPTHFILSVRVPASLAPEEAVAKLENDRQKVFFFAGTEQRLPYLKLRATSVSDIPKSRSQWQAAESKNLAAAEASLRQVIENLKSKYAAVSATKPEHRSGSFGGGKIEDSFEAFLYFQFGTSLSDVSVPTNVEVLDRKTPAEYVLQLVMGERLSDLGRQQLMSAHPLILEVRRFQEW